MTSNRSTHTWICSVGFQGLSDFVVTYVNSTNSGHFVLFSVDDSSSAIQCIFAVIEEGLYNVTFSVTEASSYSHILEVTVSSFDEATSLIDLSFSSSTMPLLIDQQITPEMHIDGVTLTNQARVDTYPFVVVSNVEFAFYLHLFDISLVVLIQAHLNGRFGETSSPILPTFQFFFTAMESLYRPTVSRF